MKPWSTSNRRQRLPRNWAKLRDAVKRRADGMCEQCGRLGNQCDHVEAGDNHHLSNLQWLCIDCHNAKTLHEAEAGRKAKAKATQRVPPKHPGLI